MPMEIILSTVGVVYAMVWLLASQVLVQKN